MRFFSKAPIFSLEELLEKFLFETILRKFVLVTLLNDEMMDFIKEIKNLLEGSSILKIEYSR